MIKFLSYSRSASTRRYSLYLDLGVSWTITPPELGGLASEEYLGHSIGLTWGMRCYEIFWAGILV